MEEERAELEFAARMRDSGLYEWLAEISCLLSMVMSGAPLVGEDRSRLNQAACRVGAWMEKRSAAP